ncbi:HNH/ENDO VII family nuclease [Desulfobaculum bizertense]|uniref:A nuclease of the HNH/ENDO VII superfamily with conserved LHH n=1 Tax=Desulfobaculum bizertense DSM 18034 TaxID=1121442 RepID=A0A1T4VSP7_9BACT|nr:HNH/ENDO VII family nuclease [Desulfobaculum bizertense]SKA67939.1 A nuclease of the HNH/ENDO VII superfamily with conserved LHH [Desulfobaculum bizertense DSM 18034]
MTFGFDIISIQGAERPIHPLEGKESVVQELPTSLEKNSTHQIKIPDIAFIENTTRLELLEQITTKNVSGFKENTDIHLSEASISKAENLNDEEKTKIQEETGWSLDIVENINNMAQYEILKNANLKEANIDGRNCLIKEDIDLDYTDDDGISNKDRIARGQAPLDNKTGKPIELHHLGQKADSPLVELTVEEHRTGEYESGKKNQSLWHDNTCATEVHGEGNTWAIERRTHWEMRA